MFFELEDINRRHSAYWDLYNVNGWVTSPDNTLSWNVQRGAITGLIASHLQQQWINFQENWRLLGTKYEQPQNFRQAGIYLREVLKLENYKKAAKNRHQFAFCIGSFDIAGRIAGFRWINNGWQRTFGGFEHNFIRKIPGTILISLLTAPFSIPFELALMTYYADKTFPKEFQKGYSSYFNCLRRIPFEEGPYWLFKNSTPIFLRNFFQTFTLFYMYDFLKDKLSWSWRVGEVPFLPMKIFIISLTTWFACVFSYPWGVVTRNMVDFWPKEKGGVCTFDNNYRKAAVWLYYHEGTNIHWAGMFNNYFWRNFPWMFTTLYVADNLGIFTYQSIDLLSGPGNNTWEDSFM